MRGHIVQRSKNKGTWSIVIELDKGPDGKRRQQWTTFQGSHAEAQKKLTEILHQRDTGNYDSPGKTTVAAFLDKWLVDYAKPNLTPRSYERYESISRIHLIPALGNIRLTQLRANRIQDHYVSMLDKGLSPRSVRYHHVVLHKALVTAVRWGLVSRNAADGVDIPRPRRSEIQTWDESEIYQFLDTAKDSQYYALFYLALYTGMRRGELLALRWQDIDFIYSQIYVNRSLHHLKDGSYVFTAPKSERSRRTIALPPSAFLIMSEYHKQKEAESTLLGTILNDSELVFSALGKPLRPNTVSRAWSNLAIKAGVRVIRLHDARHTHASLMLKQGIHPKVVQERLGHSTISITLDTYSHVAPGLQDAAAKRFDDALQVRHNGTVKSVPLANG